MALFLAGAGGAAQAGEPAEAPGTAESRAGFEAGKLHAAREALAEVMPLKVEKGRLALDREHWDRPAGGKDERKKLIERIAKQYTDKGVPKETAQRLAERLAGTTMGTGLQGVMNRLRMAVGSQGYSRSGGSGGAQRTSFGGQGLTVGVLCSPGSFQASIQEEDRPWRTLHFSTDSNGLRIVLVSPHSEFVLMLRQSADGAISVTETCGEKVLKVEAPSFGRLCREHRRYVTERLLPLLSHNGLGAPLTPYSPEIRAKVLDMLRGELSDEETKETLGLIAQLDDPSYARREEATRVLSENFDRYREHVLRAADDQALSAEARARLRKIIEEGRPTKDLHAVVMGLGLLDDPAYLVELLEQARGNRDRERIAARLEKTTGRKLGTDVAKWKRLLEDKPPREDARQPEPQPGANASR